MFNLDKFIADSVTFRPVSMFAADTEANKEVLTREIGDMNCPLSPIPWVLLGCRCGSTGSPTSGSEGLPS